MNALDQILRVVDDLFYLCQASRVAVDLDALLDQLVVQRVADEGIQTPHGLLLPQNQFGVGAQGLQHPRQLDGNVSGADHHRVPGLLLQLEKAIAGDAVLANALALREDRVSAGGDQYVFGGDRLGDDPRGDVECLFLGPVLDLLHHLDVDRVGILREAGRPPHPLDAGVLEVALVDAVEPPNVQIPLLLQKGPVKGDGVLVGVVKSVPVHLVDRLGDRGGVPQHLFGNAADVDAGSPQPLGLGDGDGLVPRAGGSPGTRDAPRSGADHEQVVVESVVQVIRTAGGGCAGAGAGASGGGGGCTAAGRKCPRAPCQRQLLCVCL
mmetsp:Transcript_6192/g.17638  ORF Transcript_6192/g.17638 Transcript_6192/m.17638 type:complete len:323 (+) Transcript_6192:1049-2017(+)